jgi:protein-disulfide isomerase
MSEVSYTLKTLPTEYDNHLGLLSATIVIVEYADFQCPVSAATSTVLDKIFQTYDDVCIVYRHFPVLATHPNSGVAAVASEAAAKQNKFWEMHHAMFENQHDLSTENIFTLAKDLDLDMRDFLNDLEDEQLLQKVRNDYNHGVNDGVSSTPTLFVNGIRFEGLPSFEELREEIDQMLQDNQSYL